MIPIKLEKEKKGPERTGRKRGAGGKPFRREVYGLYGLSERGAPAGL